MSLYPGANIHIYICIKLSIHLHKCVNITSRRKKSDIGKLFGKAHATAKGTLGGGGGGGGGDRNPDKFLSKSLQNTTRSVGKMRV
jgi:hypothetical protein